MALSKQKFDKYLEIKNNIVYTKKKAKVYIDLTEYKEIDENFDASDLADEEISQVSSNTYEIPGVFTLEFPDDLDSIQFYFPYMIYMFIPEDSIENSKEIVLNFKEGDAVFYAKFKKEETNIKILNKLFENGVKYLSNRIDLLIYNIWKQINATLNIPWHHIEMIISQMYAIKENGRWIPVGLSENQTYCKKCALNTKESAHKLNDLLGFFYGYSNEAIMNAIIKQKSSNKEITSFIEKIIKGEI